MKFRVEKKLFAEALRYASVSGGKPIVSTVKVVADSSGIVITGVNEGATILSGVWLRPKQELCEVIDKGSVIIDLTELIKEIPKMKSDTITVYNTDRTLVIEGSKERLEKEVLIDEAVMPLEFMSDGKALKLKDKEFDSVAKGLLTEFDELPIETPTVILKASDGKIQLIAQDQVSKYERIFDGGKAEGEVELWLDYDYFNMIARSLKKSDLVDIWFNEMVMMARGTREWGEQAYMLVGKEKEM